MVADLQALLNDTDPRTPGMENARAFPKVAIPPELWMLGSSEDSATLAALTGLPYNFAYFINPQIRPDIFDYYREHFEVLIRRERSDIRWRNLKRVTQQGQFW